MNLLGATDPLVSLLIFVVVVIGSALSNYLKRKRSREHDTTDTTSAPKTLPRQHRAEPAPAPPPRAASWEEEIRRMLEGEAVPPPAPPPPIVIVETRKPPVPARPVRAEPPPSPLHTIEVPPIFSRKGQTEESESHELHKVREHMAKLPQSESAYTRALQLHGAVAQRLEAVEHATMTARPTAPPGRKSGRTAEADAVLKLLHRPHTARQVMIAQVVLGTPKALEN